MQPKLTVLLLALNLIFASTRAQLAGEPAFTSIDFPIPGFPGAAVTEALRIGPSGEIAGFYVAGGKTHGFLLSAKKW